MKYHEIGNPSISLRSLGIGNDPEPIARILHPAPDSIVHIGHKEY